MSTLNVEFLKQENSSSNNVTLDSDGSVAINRHTSDGTIIDLQKDGTSVGTIGTSTSYTNQLEIKSSSSNLILNANGSNYSFDAVQFYPLTSGRSLGLASNPFNNLYLSGGAYIGGTGSANYLNDYEEGTYTPAFVSGTFTYSARSGQYTKIGNLVSVNVMIIWSANNQTGDVLKITLPFTVTSSSPSRFVGSVGYLNGVDTTTNGYQIAATTSQSSSDITFIHIRDNTSPLSLTNGSLNTSGEFQFSLTYQTDA